uniref:Synaptic vesicular amine transporter n=1 Tax=Magallana gigas TaxID=29159 RepID=K1QYP2_MAGGI
MELDRIDDPDKNGNKSIRPNLAITDKNISDSLSFTKQLLQESYKALDENSQVGLLLSSKALVQILANPCVGCLSERYGYHILLTVGTVLLLISSLVYACAGSFVSFLAGRLVHGIASAFTSIAALSILAELYSSDLERSKVMGVAMGGVAFGVVGIIMFTTMAMSTLEPTIPIWIIDTMKVPKWQLGLVFLPDSIGYFIGTNFFGAVAKQIGRYSRCGFDASASFIGGYTANGFLWNSLRCRSVVGLPCIWISLMWSLGGLLILTSPCAIVLRSVKTKEDCMSLILDSEDEALVKVDTPQYKRLYTDD